MLTAAVALTPLSDVPELEKRFEPRVWDESASISKIVVTDSGVLQPAGQKRACPTPEVVSKSRETAPRKASTPSRTHPSGVEQWRGAVRQALQQHGVWTQWWEDKTLSIIRKESGGNPNARNGQHVGLFQFNNAWASESKRYDPHWSINRFARVLSEGGEAKIRQHWRATW